MDKIKPDFARQIEPTHPTTSMKKSEIISTDISRSSKRYFDAQQLPLQSRLLMAHFRRSEQIVRTFGSFATNLINM